MQGVCVGSMCGEYVRGVCGVGAGEHLRAGVVGAFVRVSTCDVRMRAMRILVCVCICV
jgi:hypothetical protein